MGTPHDAALGLPLHDPVTINVDPIDAPLPMSKHSAWQEMVAAAKALGLDRFRSWNNVKADVEGLPLVMTGPDSTRTLDNLTTWGVRLVGPSEDDRWEWQTADGKWFWAAFANDGLGCWIDTDRPDLLCFTERDAKANPPTIPPPDWNPHDGTKPGPTTPSRTDAATSSRKVAVLKEPDRYGVVLAREFNAYVRLKATLTTREQHDALTAYSEAIDASRDALNASLRGGAK